MTAASSSGSEPEPPLLEVEVVALGGDWASLGSTELFVEAVARAVAEEIELGDGPVSAALALSDDTHVRSLNRDHRGKDAPTNVLSFPADAWARSSSAGEVEFLGDIVIAWETVLREAAAEGKSVVHHAQHLIAHGLLHLAGFDHETDADAEEMEAIEIAVLARLGITNPYDSVSDGSLNSEEKAATPK